MTKRIPYALPIRPPVSPNGKSKGAFGANSRQTRLRSSNRRNADASRPSVLVSIEWIAPYQASAATHKDLTLIVGRQRDDVPLALGR
jgi:hypothetical protein